MNKPIYDFFENDHRRIDQLLDKAVETPGIIQEDFYHQFRTALLKHIKMEEKTLFPTAQKANGGEPIPRAAQLRLEHGALTSLMVVPPSPEVILVIRHLLEVHDQIEEAPGGTYDICEKLTAEETENLLEVLRGITEVPVHPHNKADYALEAAKRSMTRAGYDFDAIIAKQKNKD